MSGTQNGTQDETQNETEYRKTKRNSGEQSETARIYSTPAGEAPKELSAFSTVSKYNTQDRRTIASHGNIHNMNTNPTGSLISNWCSVCGHKKNGGREKDPVLSFPFLFCCGSFC